MTTAQAVRAENRLINGWTSVLAPTQWRADTGAYLQLGALWHPAHGYKVYEDRATVGPEGHRATQQALGQRIRAWAIGLGAVPE